MNTPFFYGLVLALVNIVLSLVGYFLGFQTERLEQGRWFALVSVAVTIVILWLGIRAVRADAKDQTLSYGKGVGTGFLITLYSSLIGAVYGFIHFKFINPAFVDYQIDAARAKWVEAGLGDAQMDAAEKFMRFVMSPVALSLTSFFGSLVIGLVIVLVLAAFLRRKPSIEPANAPIDVRKDGARGLYLYVLRQNQPPTQEMMQAVLNGYRERFGEARMLGGMVHQGALPTGPDEYVIMICLQVAKQEGLDFISSRDEISYSTDTIFGESVGVCRIRINSPA